MDEALSTLLKSYLDVYLFLQDSYHAIKKSSPGFTYESWATELNISSRSYLREAVYGKRKISEELTQKLCDFYQFKDSDRDYFILLVQYTQARVSEQKKLYGRQLTDILKSQPIEKNKVDWSNESTCTPLAIVVRDLLSFKDFEATLENLQKYLNVPLADLKKTLNALELENLVERQHRQWRACHDYLKIEDKPSNTALMQFHRSSLEKAIQALTSPSKERYYRSVTLALSEEHYCHYLNEMKKFIESIFSQFGSETLDSRRIYQMNFNLFPWTPKYTTVARKQVEEKTLDLF